MAKNTFQLNFDELTSITKIFKDEGEDIARLHSSTRQRVRDMHKEWIGEAADKFFEEMETELLPALQRLTQALIHSQDATNEIMKIIRDADEETAGYFRDQLSGDDFGAAQFGAALEGLQRGRTAADDFGAGKFGEALGSVSGGGSPSSPADSGGAKFGEAAGGGQSAGEQRDGSQQPEKGEMETETTPAGGGSGGGSESSQGLQGDLKKMGAGLGSQAPQSASAGGGSGTKMADHVYSSGSSSGPGDKSQSATGGGTSGGGEQPSPEEGAGAAGAAGVAGAAAAGGAAKVIKDKQKKSE
jgi:WXG100 family type VII secretion target